MDIISLRKETNRKLRKKERKKEIVGQVMGVLYLEYSNKILLSYYY
jgi:hypothetical protein